MTATATTTHRTLVSLGLPPQVSGLTAYAQHILTSMTGNATLPNPVRKPRVFAATPAGVTGSVKLVAASAGRRAAHNWQYSLDGGKTWVDAASTLQAKATITGLTAGATVQFRYQLLIKTGEENWSQVVQLVVV
jgi:hypothetical protein